MVAKQSAAKKSESARLSDDIGLEDAILDAWPDPPPRAPRSATEATRLALIGAPGVVHVLSPVFSDVGRASKLAAAFRRARPAGLDPNANGTYDARAFFDPEAKRWRVAARYVAEPATPDASPGG
ncbi:MAG: hypothetical protein ACRDZQ_11645 [Acidimicrobiales bacterium]